MKLLIIFFFTLLLLAACKTEEPQNPPTVLTVAATDVQLKSAILGGEVTEEGFSATTERGFVYSEKNINPSVSDNKIQSGFGKGSFSLLIDKLNVNTKYYFKAYALNTKGTSYGTLQSFTTSDYKPSISILETPKNISYTTVELFGSVTDDGGGNIIESGFVLGLNSNPSITDLKFPVSKGKSTIALIITKLNVNTKYYARTYSINEKGISYGNEYSFTTLDFKLPTLESTKISDVTGTSVIVNSTILEEGGGIIEKGFVYGTTQNPTLSNNKIIFTNETLAFEYKLNDLNLNTTYYIRSFATNKKGTNYGEQNSFTTLQTDGKLNYVIYNTEGSKLIYPYNSKEFDELIFQKPILKSGSIFVDTDKEPNLLNWYGYGNKNLNALLGTQIFEYFSLVVDGFFIPNESGEYQFSVEGDDAVDFTINGNIIVSNYGIKAYLPIGTHIGKINLTKGVAYTIRVRMQDGTNDQALFLFWRRPSKQIWQQDWKELSSKK